MMFLAQAAGHQLLPEPEGADVCVINTCGFIDAAKEEAIAAILRVAALKEAGLVGKILVSGRLAQRYRGEIPDPPRGGRDAGHRAATPTSSKPSRT